MAKNVTKVKEKKSEVDLENQEEQTEKTEEQTTHNFEKEVNELKDKNLRLLAEFENYKKRTAKEKESAYDYAACNTILNILPVFDTLKAALQHSDAESFKSGIEMVAKQFSDALTKIGVVEIEALNNQFDPELHHAVMRDEESDAESGVIVEEFQKGYKLKDNVIRHSMVKVKA